MKDMKQIGSHMLNSYKCVDETAVDKKLIELLAHLNKKIVVFDDDPTGVQTVHGISVYTDWSENSILEGFQNPDSIFFILTNSRGLTIDQTTIVHKEIARNLSKVYKQTGIDFILMSRSDSTLRGHYPLETQILKEELEKDTDKRYDGEIILPFFKEGGRFTIGNVHYVKQEDQLIPAAQTEFAQDKSYGYKESDLTKWCEEKTGGEYTAETVTCITLESLRNIEIDKIADQLMGVSDFNKIIVNAIDYVDVKVFTIAYILAVLKGKEFIFCCAAAITKVLGGVLDKPLLTKNELVAEGNNNGGIVLVGSHVHKTSLQLDDLRNSVYPIEFIEFNQHLVLIEGGLEEEVDRIIETTEEFIKSGKTVVIYTRRERFDLDTDDKDAQLVISIKISNAVTSIIEKLSVRPSFIIAKGGITSSDVGTKALKVRKALVMGQIKPGIPVWMPGEESKFPNMPFIIFPGNVGEISTLREVVEILL